MKKLRPIDFAISYPAGPICKNPDSDRTTTPRHPKFTSMIPQSVSQCSQLLQSCLSPGASVFRLAARTRALSVSALLVAVTVSPAFGQSAPANNVQTAPKTQVLELDKLTVTGSNIRMTAADADKGALPVEIISS